MRKNSAGFTLIELLIVIAVIGILTAVVLASVNLARSKAADGAARLDLTNIRGQGALYYEANRYNYGNAAVGCNSAGTVFDPTLANNINKLITGAENSVGNPATCSNDIDVYAVALQLKDGTVWCIDSSGYSNTTAVATSTIQANRACQ